MPDVTYPKNANSDTVFVEEGGKKTRAIKTVEPDGTVTYPSNANSENCYVTVDGKKQRALMTAPQDTSTLEYPNNPNSTKGYVTVNGKKQRVVITANIAGGGSAPVIDELNVTPSTSAQTITASGGTDGYSPVNVSAVDASIDANITAGNIKSGTTILGVTGNVVELNGETKTVTPQVYGQTLYPTSPKNAITEITVNAVTSSIDANIQAENIKKDVTILGVIGTYDAGGGGSGRTVEYTLNAQYNWLDCQLDTAKFNSLVAGVTQLKAYQLAGICWGNQNIGAIDMHDLKSAGTVGSLTQAFYSSSITSLDLSNVESITGTDVLSQTCYQCSQLTTVNVSSVRTISGSSPTYLTFGYCANLSEVNWASLTAIGTVCFSNTFAGCNGIVIKFPNISSVNNNGIRYLFRSTSGGTTQNVVVHFPSNMEATVKALSSYSDTAPFGATSGTVLFDLPATVTLTGADSINYLRNPKYDTATALGWCDSTDNDWNPVYTSGTTDPQVNDTIYSDDACTTPVTTISSIA